MRAEIISPVSKVTVTDESEEAIAVVAWPRRKDTLFSLSSEQCRARVIAALLMMRPK